MARLVDLGCGEEIGCVDEQFVARGIPEWVRPRRDGGWTEPLTPPEGMQQIRPDGIALLVAWPRRKLLDDLEEILGDDLDEILRKRIRKRRQPAVPNPE